MFDRTLLQLPGDHLPRPHGNCYWVVPGQVMAGEYPCTTNDAKSREKLAAILGVGIRQFIDLTEATEPLADYKDLLQSVAARAKTHARHDRFSIRDVSIPTSEHMRSILDAITGAASSGRTVYVHCWGGIGRIGTVVGCLLIESGFTPEESIALIAQKWTVMDKRHVRPQSPETAEQFSFIRTWRQDGQLSSSK